MPTTTRGIRYPVLTDTANVPRDIGYTAADVETWLARARDYASAVSVDNVASTTTLVTIVIPSQPIASRIKIRFGGLVGFCATSGIGVGVTLTASAGTLTNPIGAANNVYLAASGVWGAYTYEAWLVLAASTATTLTLSAYSSSGNAYYRGMLTAEIKYAGEYA